MRRTAADIRGRRMEPSSGEGGEGGGMAPIKEQRTSIPRRTKEHSVFGQKVVPSEEKGRKL